MGKRRENISIIDFYDMESPESTEFRRVLHNINGSSAGGDKRIVMITSAILSEGKSVISSFLAITAATFKNRKTLLIDFDLRRPMAHKLFSLPLEDGIADVLFDGVAPRNVIKKTPLENLDLLTAGRVMSNPSELFNSTTIHKVFEEMRFYYELILVDSPPVLPVMDPMILLEELDGAIIVVKAGATRREVAQRARDLLSSQKDKIIGVVVNNLHETLPYYYDYAYYGYRHKPSER